MPTPFWGSLKIPTCSGLFLEIFAGEAGLSQAIIARGTKILPPIEILLNSFVLEAVDVLDLQVQDHLKKLIVQGCIVFYSFWNPLFIFQPCSEEGRGTPTAA